ncbi:hypothetical protein Taro_053520 [Colocasia esculenta]|uniref:SHSP domain-containing protein n=1 Tax=Colocasia esculenta TaxID=4460 RepID=A0A843XLH1_COLES|nr:hypothetical protein [Colocasia esculenta]
MKVHPAPPKKRNITFRYDVGRSLSAAEALLGRQKKLRRLPHIFSKVLELPFAADADVDVQEGADVFQFVVSAGGVVREGARAQAVEIHPGVTKVVIRDGEDGGGGGDNNNNIGLLLDDLELDRWRFRLPPCTRPELASAVCADGELIVIVPKGAVADGGEDGTGEEVWGEGNGNLGGSGRLIIVQQHNTTQPVSASFSQHQQTATRLGRRAPDAAGPGTQPRRLSKLPGKPRSSLPSNTRNKTEGRLCNFSSPSDPAL